MGANGNVAPVIIKRKKVIRSDGHHGGAWKVAYADFVTAMMAFFMLMWLLGATTEKQRKGIADYFNPTIPIHRISGGDDGFYGGDSTLKEATLVQNGTGTLPVLSRESGQEGAGVGLTANADAAQGDDKALEEVRAQLMGFGGESLVTENALKHVMTRVTDEGLVIELFDLPDLALFEDGTATAMPILEDLVRMIADAVGVVSNAVAVEAHTKARPRAFARDPGWALSSERADQARQLLVRHGLSPARMTRVTGHSDREPVTDDPMAVRNNRVEIILLRSDQ